VVDFNLAFFQFIWKCNSENIIKIGPYLPKLLQENFGAVFLAHPVYCNCLCGSLAQCALSLKPLSAGTGFNP